MWGFARVRADEIPHPLSSPSSPLRRRCPGRLEDPSRDRGLRGHAELRGDDRLPQADRGADARNEAELLRHLAPGTADAAGGGVQGAGLYSRRGGADRVLEELVVEMMKDPKTAAEFQEAMKDE